MTDDEVVSLHYMALIALAEVKLPKGYKLPKASITRVEGWTSIRDEALAEIYKRKLGIKRLKLRLSD